MKINAINSMVMKTLSCCLHNQSNFVIINNEKVKKQIMLFLTFLFFALSLSYAQCPDHTSNVCDGQTVTVDLDTLPFCDIDGIDIEGDINQNLDCEDAGGLNCFEFKFIRSENSLTESFSFFVGQGQGCTGELDASYFVYDGTACTQLSTGGSQTFITFDFPTGINEIWLYLCINSNAQVTMCDVCRERPPCTVDVTCKQGIDFNGNYCENAGDCALPAPFTDPLDVFEFVETCDFELIMEHSDAGEVNCTDENGDDKVNVTRTYTLKYFDPGSGVFETVQTCDQLIELTQENCCEPAATCNNPETVLIESCTAEIPANYDAGAADGEIADIYSAVTNCGTPGIRHEDSAVSGDICSQGGATITRTYYLTDDGIDVPGTACSRDFVFNAPGIVVECPAEANVNLPACSTAQEIADAYATWSSGFSVSGGCNTVDNLQDLPALPAFVCGGEVSLTFDLSATDDCGSSGCSGSFNVAAADPLVVECPVEADVNLPACSTAQEIADAYATWSSGFSVSGGCNTVDNLQDLPALPDFVCGGAVALQFSLSASDDCGSDGCSGSFNVAAADPLVVECPVEADVNLPACSTAQEIADAYATWSSGFSVSGGCNATSNIQDLPALPDFVCGGAVALQFSLSASDDCGSDGCSGSFNVAAADPLVVECPVDADVNLPACSTAQEIADAYATWSSGFSVSGGCNTSSNIQDFPALPDFVCGGAVALQFSLSASDDCGSDGCSGSFNVAAATPLAVDCPAPVALGSSLTEQEILDAYNAWVAGFSVSGGCNPSSNIAQIPALPPYECGSGVDISFDLLATDDCGTATCGSTFTVEGVLGLTVDCPAAVVLDECATEQEIQDAYDAWVAGFGVNNGDNPTSNIGDIPALPDFACGGLVDLDFTLTAFDDCNPNGVSCSSTFMVKEASPLVIDCPADVFLPECSTAQEIADAYATWAAGFIVGGGCNTESNIGDIPALPAFVCGGGVNLAFGLTATDDCGSASCSAVFNVAAATPLTVDCPQDVFLPECSTEGEIAAAYALWAAGFAVNDGCNATSNIQEVPVLPDFVCGAGVNLVFGLTANDDCGSASCSAVFNVAASTPLSVDCPADVNETGPISAQEISDLYDAWVAGFIMSGGCPDASSNIDQIPLLPEYECGVAIDLQFTLTAFDSCNPNGISCSSTFHIDKTDPVNAGDDGALEVCEDDNSDYNLRDYITGEDDGGSWSGPGGAHDGIFNAQEDAEGIYTYTVQGTDPCPDDSSTVTVTVNPVPEIILGDPICSEGDDFGTYSVDITTNGGTLTSDQGDVTDNGGNSWTVSNIPNGVNANIEVTNDNECKNTAEVVAPECICLEFEFSWTNVTCEGENDGTITIDFVTPGATILLNGQPFVEGQLYPPGEYTIEAFFNNNDPDCYFSETFEILEPPAVTVQASGTDETCFDANDGTITVFGLSENACYVILKNGTGQDLSDQDFFEPGIYFVVATVCEDFIQNRVVDPCEAFAVVTIKGAKGSPCGIQPGYDGYPDCDTPEVNFLNVTLQEAVENPECHWELDAASIANGWNMLSPSNSPTMYFEPGVGRATFTVTLFNEGECEQICTFITKSACASPKKGVETFSMYPNPVKDVLTVDFKKSLQQDTSIEIYDLLGNSVYLNRLNKGNKSNVQIDFSSFPSNVYYLKVIDKNGTTIKKVILDR